MAGFACSKKPAQPATDIWRLRNSGRLLAALDTQEGFDRAAAAFAQLAEGGEDPTDSLNLARVRILGGQPELAQAALERFRALWPKGTELPADVAYLEGLALKGMGKPREAADRFGEVTRRDAKLEPGWFQLGTALALAKDFAGALGAFDKLLEINPRHLAGHYKRSMAFRGLGEAAKADEALTRFTALKKESGDASSDDKAYEKCSYTRVQLRPPAGSAPSEPPVELVFEDATEAAGLAACAPGAACVLDHDRDGDADLYLVRSGPNQLLRNDGGRFADATELSDAADAGKGVLAEPSDFNNDGLLDIFVGNLEPACVLLKGLGEGVFQPLKRSGLELPGSVRAARWVDYDHDGDVDLVTLEALEAGPAAACEARVHRNNGDETFLLVPGLLEGRIGGLSIALGDFDGGNDVDFAFANGEGEAAVFLNLRQGPFRRAAMKGFSGHRFIATGDLDGDGEADLLGEPTGQKPLEVALSRGPAGLGEPPAFTIAAAGGGERAPDSERPLLADLDNDGDLDAVTSSGCYRNGGGTLARTPFRGPSTTAEPPGALHAVFDFDGDGRLDLLLAGLKLWRNTSRAYPSVTLRLTGGRDNRDGTGSHVELRSGPRYARRLVEATGSLGAGLGVRFGLGSVPLEALDGFEVLWPNGIAQPLLPSDLKWDEKRRLDVTQKRGLTVSCPFLFVHDGERYRFLTDIVGIAPLDEWLPGGASPHLDPEEYVRIPGARLKAVDGRLRLAITEELRETTYLDRLRLLRITHPEGTLCLGNETTRQGAMDPLEVWIVRERSVEPAARAVSSARGDLTALVKERDGVYSHPYGDSPSQWAGWVPIHTLDLTPQADRLPAGGLLLLTGRIYWPDSSVTFAVSQHGRTWIPPSLHLVGRDGRTFVCIEDAGFPCGMDRVLAFPLALQEGVSASEIESVRLRTSHRFLWDQAAFAREAVFARLPGPGEHEVVLGGERMRLEVEELPILSQVLAFRGVSRVVGDLERHEQSYDFHDTIEGLTFQIPRGRATPHGDVRELVLEPDSRLVVIPPGDVLLSEFGAGDAVPGVATTYFLQVTGWAKESNFHNRTGRFIEPLPFHGMDGYPPSRSKR